ncbi:hypothetical protein [Actinomyces ruminis]|uniref:hypothetical protein n=1 Tax=Actinomyces ruminis TaxID=1937003 RepID=UPI0030B82399
MTIAPGLVGRTLIKGHAAGSDLLLLVDPEREAAFTAADVAAVCDRHTGLGAAGLVRVVHTAALPGTESFRTAVPEAEWFLDYYLADGTPAAGTAAAYGDACRLLSAVLDAEGLMPLADGDSVTIGTRGGARTVTRLDELWAVDAGPARLAAVNEPAADPADEAGTPRCASPDWPGSGPPSAWSCPGGTPSSPSGRRRNWTPPSLTTPRRVRRSPTHPHRRRPRPWNWWCPWESTPTRRPVPPSVGPACACWYRA